tara:strand:+ start:29256 stop:30239 length:984 start_codon:yes stop_codon:yes gene_type:complete
MTIKKDYRTAEGISYSALSRLSEGPNSYINKPKIEGDFLDNGSAVDVLLTEGEEAFYKQFYIMTASKPSSDMMMTYTQTMIDTDNSELAFAASGYKKAVTDSKWETEGKPYYDAVKDAGNKIVIDFDQHTKITATVNQLKTNNFTSAYFSSAVKKDSEIIYQFTHYWNFTYVDEKSGHLKTRKAKLKADILVINHTTKKIFGKDLKTTGKPTESFKTSYRNYKYYLQEGLYQEGILDWAKEHYPEYTVEPFEFIVAQMGAYTQPLIYTVSETEHACNMYGGETGSGYYIKGVVDLLEDLEYYENQDNWQYKREIVNNNGRVDLELFK